MNQLSEKTIKTLEIVLGIVCGLGTWALLWLSGKTTDGLLQWAWVALFAVIMFGSKALEKKMERQLKTFRIVLLISLAAGLVAFVLLAFVFKAL